MRRTHPLLTLTLLFLIFSVTCGHAEMRPAKKIRAGVPPFDVIKDTILANRNNASGTQKTPPSRSEKGHTPFMTWLADSDDRIQAGLISKTPKNTVYAVRNLANQLSGATGAVDYGVRHLRTPILLITGNTDSQVIRHFMEGYTHLGREIREALDHLHIPLSIKKKDHGTTPSEKGKEAFNELWLKNVERNVDFQVDLALDRYKDRVEGGRLVVVGGVIDLANRYGHGAERLVIININGEKDTVSLRKTRHLSKLNHELMKTIGRDRLKKTKE